MRNNSGSVNKCDQSQVHWSKYINIFKQGLETTLPACPVVSLYDHGLKASHWTSHPHLRGSTSAPAELPGQVLVLTEVNHIQLACRVCVSLYDECLTTWVVASSSSCSTSSSCCCSSSCSCSCSSSCSSSCTWRRLALAHRLNSLNIAQHRPLCTLSTCSWSILEPAPRRAFPEHIPLDDLDVDWNSNCSKDSQIYCHSKFWVRQARNCLVRPSASRKKEHLIHLRSRTNANICKKQRNTKVCVRVMTQSKVTKNTEW